MASRSDEIEGRQIGEALKKSFNVTGLCYRNENYMVNIEDRLKEIKKLGSRGDNLANLHLLPLLQIFLLRQ